MLEPHVRCHTKELSPHVCDINGCGKRYMYASGLAAHKKRMHAKKRDYPCLIPDCSRSFFTMSELKTHLKMHISQPYPTNKFEKSRM